MSYKLRKVINANGRMTILGVSKFSPEVGQAIIEAGSQFYVMKEFKESVNSQINKIFKSKNLHVVNSASSGIALTVAAAIYQDRVYSVNDNQIDRREIVIPKGHNVDYGAPIESMIKLVGGKVVEAGWSNTCSPKDIVYKINDNTAALLYVVSHHCVDKEILELDEMIKISKQFKIPLIVDCAAEEDFLKYSRKEIDAVIFSGSKAIEGPTSGIVFGDNIELIENVKKHSEVIGRAMKIGKENIYGLLKAVENYQINKRYDVNIFLKKFETLKNIDINQSTDVRGITRITLDFSKVKKITAKQISQTLKNGQTAIYLRDYLANQNILEVDLRNIDENDCDVIVEEIEKLI